MAETKEEVAVEVQAPEVAKLDAMEAEADEFAKEESVGEEVAVVKERFPADAEGFPKYTLLDPCLNNKWIMRIVKFALLGLLILYTIVAVSLDFDRAAPILFMEIFVLSILVLALVAKLLSPCLNGIRSTLENLGPKARAIGYTIVIIVLAITAIALSVDDLSRLIALFGLLAMIFICWVFSYNRWEVKWRPVIWGFILQYILGVFILRTDQGQVTFKFLGEQAEALIAYTNVGVQFVFGEPLFQLGPFFLTVLPVIIFFSGLTSVFFYLGALQKFTFAVSKVMEFTMGTSGPESLSAAGNIFLGQTEGPLLIRPYLKFCTNSELHCIMTAGFATIAGGVLAAFIGFGIPAEHLIAASVMSAPAAMAISKIIYPETVKVDDSSVEKLDTGEVYSNAFEAFSSGASISISLIANIVVNLIAYLAAIAFLDRAFPFVLTKIGADSSLNFTRIVGYIFSPFAFLIGIPTEDVVLAGELIGIKIVANEFAAFLFIVFGDGGVSATFQNAKTLPIITYALCGFSNFSSIGIQLGALGAMAPSKRTALSKMALSAMIAGNIACFMTACIAGVLLKE